MKRIVDSRGLTCPQPVIMTRQALNDHTVDEVVTIVDNLIAVENVSKLASSMNLETNIVEKSGQFFISILKDELIEDDLRADRLGEVVVLVTSNVLGQGEDKLGSLLMKSFLYTLTQMEGDVKGLIFMNSGVLLTTEGSEVIDYLESLVAKGIELISCGTCLDYYRLSDKLKIGSVTNMFTITERLMEARKVITL